MTDEHRDTVTRRASRSFKPLWIFALLVGLILSNLATLLSSSYHDALYRALSAQLLAMIPNSAPKLLTKSISAQNGLLRNTQRRLVLQNRALQSEKKFFASRISDFSTRISAANAKNRALQVALNNVSNSTELNRNAVKDFKKKSIDRMVRSKVVNLASLPERALPIIGTMVLVGAAAYEINSDCEMLRDITGLAAASGIKGKDPGEDEICGLKVPTVVKWGELKSSVENRMRAFEISSIAAKFKITREDLQSTLERTYLPTALIEQILDSLGY
jgi:hypothetical protein